MIHTVDCQLNDVHSEPLLNVFTAVLITLVTQEYLLTCSKCTITKITLLCRHNAIAFPLSLLVLLNPSILMLSVFLWIFRPLGGQHNVKTETGSVHSWAIVSTVHAGLLQLFPVFLLMQAICNIASSATEPLTIPDIQTQCSFSITEGKISD